MASFGLGRQTNTNNNNASTAIEPSTPWMAVSEGNLNLLQSSINSLQLTYNVADENGYTLLHAAASYNQLEIIKFLLGQNSNINAIDNDGDTALHYSSKVDSAKLLIEIGKIDRNIKNKNGKTALESKQEELNEMMTDDDVEDDDEEIDDLKALISYLSS